MAYPAPSAHRLMRPLLLGALICAALYALVRLRSGGVGGGAGVVYGCMMDAGSTGSRIHVYTFNRAASGRLSLLDELFLEVKPGLSSFKGSPSAGGASLQPLLDAARAKIPAEKLASTPIYLYATAGLRLLGLRQSTALLEAARDTLQASPFHFQRENVALIDGSSEGLFGWITVNFLLHRFDPGATEPTVGIMDMGGASTQIVFGMRHGQYAAPADRQQVVMGGKTHDVYVHSYLGFGLMEAGKRVLGHGGKTHRGLQHPCLPKGHSITVADKYTTLPAKTGAAVTVVGADGGFAECDATTSALMRKGTRCARPPCAIDGRSMPPVQGTLFYAFSYFFDRTQQMKLPKDTPIPVSSVAAAAQAACSGDVAALQQYSGKAAIGQLCLDVCYLNSLLERGYGFAPDAKLVIAKKIGGVETSWALGAMLKRM